MGLFENMRRVFGQASERFPSPDERFAAPASTGRFSFFDPADRIKPGFGTIDVRGGINLGAMNKMDDIRLGLGPFLGIGERQQKRLELLNRIGKKEFLRMLNTKEAIQLSESLSMIPTPEMQDLRDRPRVPRRSGLLGIR